MKELSDTLTQCKLSLREAKADVRMKVAGRGRGRGRSSVDFHSDGADIEPTTDAQRTVVALELEVGVLEEEIGRLRAGLVTGNLLEANIDRTQSLYVKAIRDLEGMKRACMAVFYHYVSTDLHALRSTEDCTE